MPLLSLKCEGVHDRPITRTPELLQRGLSLSLCLLSHLFIFAQTVGAQTLQLRVTQRYLNIPIGRQTKLRNFTISENGAAKRVFPLQLADEKVDYWIYLDIASTRTARFGMRIRYTRK
jgi:hypothetical protein